MAEVAAIAFIQDLMKSRGHKTKLRPLHVHGIGDEALGAFGASSKMNNDPEFLRHLHALGTGAAERWVAENRDAIGNHSTVDLSGLVPTRHGSLVGPSLIKQADEVPS